MFWDHVFFIHIARIWRSIPIFSLYSDQPKRMERKHLDRRRLEAAHFKFAVLCITSWYSSDIKQSPVFSSDHQKDLLKFTPIYQQAFHKKYSGIYNEICSASCQLLYGCFMHTVFI